MGNEWAGIFIFIFIYYLYFFWLKCLFELIFKFEDSPMDLKRSNFANEELKSIFFFSKS